MMLKEIHHLLTPPSSRLSSSASKANLHARFVGPGAAPKAFAGKNGSVRSANGTKPGDSGS